MKKEKLRQAITAVAGLLPLRRRVLLESSPDLACNVYPVFERMLHDARFRDVELLWLVKNPDEWAEKYPAPQVRFVAYDPFQTASRIRAIRLALTSRCILFCNKTLWSPRRGQLSLFLGHGTPIKQCKGIYTPGSFCNLWSYPSEQVKEIMQEQLGLRPEQGILLGYPRCDALFHPEGALDRIVARNGRKIVFWLPTFRQQSTQNHKNSNYVLPGCGLPLLTREGDLEQLNALCEKNGILLVLKPHPMQDMSAIRAGNFSAFRLISDTELRENHVQLYQVLADADALLTDYSSVYCDFLLTGKPIALTFDDLEQYRNSRGLVRSDIRETVKGRYLYQLSDLGDFLGELSRGEDPEKEARAFANNYYNELQDDGAAQRVADVLADFLNRS